MVNIQFWLTYHPHYGENNKIGLALMQAQTNQIAIPHFGVPITKDMLNQSQNIPEHMIIPGEKVSYSIFSLEIDRNCNVLPIEYDL